MPHTSMSSRTPGRRVSESDDDRARDCQSESTHLEWSEEGSAANSVCDSVANDSATKTRTTGHREWVHSVVWERVCSCQSTTWEPKWRRSCESSATDLEFKVKVKKDSTISFSGCVVTTERFYNNTIERQNCESKWRICTIADRYVHKRFSHRTRPDFKLTV